VKLTLHAFTTLDGVIQGPGGAEEDQSGHFPFGGWLAPYADQAMGEIVESWMKRAEAFLLGATTYRLMAGYWPQVTDPGNAAATALNSLRKFVVSGTLENPGWARTSVLTGDAIAKIRQLKAVDGGELQVHGSALLARTLHEAGLVDEYRLITFPLCLGIGKRLFLDRGPAQGFTLVDHRITGAGATYSALVPGPLRTGEFTVMDGQEHAATN
jgi:dihydrofolate reductase